VVLCIENAPALLALTFGAQRIGLYFVLVSTKASVSELTYIVEDSQARWAIVSTATEAGHDPTMLTRSRARTFTLGAQPASLLERWEPPFETPFDAVDSRNASAARVSGMTEGSVYLSTSPLYHSAPNRYLSTAVHLGATSVILERFDAELALQAIDRFQCTHGLWVPTMFHRLLRLPEEVRMRYQIDSMKAAIHGAAPCPVHIKAQMIDWWGPIISEYYSGTEGISATLITSAEWLAHRGSVGRAVDGVIHILDQDCHEVPAGMVGKGYFESDARFEYWNAPGKTHAMASPRVGAPLR